MVKHERYVRSFESTVQKEYACCSLTNSTVHDMPTILNTRYVAITRKVFLARPLRAGNSKLWSGQSPPLENVSTHLYRKLSITLNFLLCLSHTLGQRSVTRTKNYLTRPAPDSTLSSAMLSHRRNLFWPNRNAVKCSGQSLSRDRRGWQIVDADVEKEGSQNWLFGTPFLGGKPLFFLTTAS